MSTFLKLIQRMLAFIYSFKSTKLLTLISLLGILVFTLGTQHIDGVGLGSTISILGKQVPSMLIFMSFNSVFLFSTVAVVMVTFQFGEFLLFGHFAQSTIGSFNNRYEPILAYLISTFIFIIPVGVSYTSYYFWMSPNMNTFIFSVINSVLFFYSIIIITTLILNFNAFKKYALVMILVFFFVLPGTLLITIPMMTDTNIASKIIVEILTGVKHALNLHQDFSSNINFVQQRSYVNYESLFQPVGILLLYFVTIAITYKKKDFA